MASEELKQSEDGAVAALVAASGEKPRSSRRGMVLGGGIMGLIALAWALSLVAIPSSGARHPAPRRIAGPFLADVSPSTGSTR